MVPLWGMAHWAEGTCRQWLRSVIRSCSPNPCWLESAGHRPFSLGKQSMNHLNWHKLSGMLLNAFSSLFSLRELERETCSLSFKVSWRVKIHPWKHMPSLDRVQSRISDVGKAVPILWVCVTTFLHALYPFLCEDGGNCCLSSSSSSPPPPRHTPFSQKGKPRGCLPPGASA